MVGRTICRRPCITFLSRRTACRIDVDGEVAHRWERPKLTDQCHASASRSGIRKHLSRNGDMGCRLHAVRHSFAVPKPPITRDCLDRMPHRVAEIERPAHIACSRSSSETIEALIWHEAAMIGMSADGFRAKISVKVADHPVRKGPDWRSPRI